jgi:hypothetical protein
MAETHVLSALQAKHRRIKGRITALESEASDLRVDLASVEHVIRLFQQDWRDENGSIAPRKPCRWDRRGEGIKTALAVLREATEPMTAREIALAVWERTKVPMPPKEEFYRITSTFNMALSRRIGKGVIRHEGKPMRWSIERR